MANKTVEKATQTRKTKIIQKSASSPRINNDGKAEQEKIDKGCEVIQSLCEIFRGNNINYWQSLNDIEKRFDSFMSDMEQQNTDANYFTLADFAPYHIFLFHNDAKCRFYDIFYQFIIDCIHKANQVKPIETIRYQAYLDGIELLLTALGERNIKRYPIREFSHYDDEHNQIYRDVKLTPEQNAMNSLANFEAYVKMYFSKYQETIDRYENGAKIVIIKERFKDRIERLARNYQLDFDKTELKDNVLAGKIVRHFGIKETKTND